MKAPIKPGSEASKAQEGGSLGSIDEQRGDPGRGTGGTLLNPQENSRTAEPEPHDGGGADPAKTGNHMEGEAKSLYDRLADKDSEPTA